MPRRRRSTGGSAFQRVQQQARMLLSSLRDEIRGKEAELKQLRDEEALLARLGGGPGRPAMSAAPAQRRGGRAGGRVDWRAILDRLPKQFKASDVREFNEVRSKRPSEIFAAITRWIEAGSVKRKNRGVYERA
jgi:hypothetical protein